MKIEFMMKMADLDREIERAIDEWVERENCEIAREKIKKSFGDIADKYLTWGEQLTITIDTDTKKMEVKSNE